MLFVSLPFALIHSSTCIVEGASAVTKALHKAPCVLIPQRVLGARNSPQEPRVCTLSMLHNSEEEMETPKVSVLVKLYGVVWLVLFSAFLYNNNNISITFDF